MQEPTIVIQSKQPSLQDLPGVVVVPDAKKPVAMGSGIITSLISSGGMAIIYEIWNQELEVRRAIKLLHPDHTKESEGRFQTEIKITAKLHHPNIVEIYAVGKWNDLPYIEMERIDGVTLEQLIVDTGGFPVEVCTAIGIMIGRALNYAHHQEYQIYGKEYHGIIHRDLKPGNVMVTNSGIVKLMDFGIAKPLSASTKTLEGVVMGTMQYLAPEQLDGKDIDERADLYSLGAVVYEMITGTRAFPEQNLAKLVTDKLNNNYVPLDGYSRKIPAALCGLVHKCLRYEKEKRTQNALDFLRSLGQIHKSLDPKSPEQILSHYMKEAHHGKTIVSLRKNFRLPPTIKFFGIIIFLGIIMMIGALGIQRFYNELAQKWPQAKPAQKPVSGIPLPNKPQEAEPAVPHPEKLAMDSLPQKKGLSINNGASPKTELLEPAKEIKRKEKKPSAKNEIKRKKRERMESFQVENNDHAVPSAQPVPETVDKPPLPQRAEAPVKPGNKASLLERLKRQYKTSDLMVIFTGEVETGHYQDALIVSESLDKDYAGSKKAGIFKLRALKGAGDKVGFSKMLLSTEIYDGEYFLEKGLFYFDQGDFPKSQELLKKASVSPCGFLESKVFRQNLLYSVARNASALYDQKTTEETIKKAMESWYDVKSLFRTSPEHEYFKKADSEIRRISKSSNSAK
jgi:serine/threonine protein kinase